MFCRPLFVFNGVRVTPSLVLCVCFVDRCLFLMGFVLLHFVLAIVLSVLLRFTDSDYPLWYIQTLHDICPQRIHIINACTLSVLSNLTSNINSK